jgi:nucleotide-binding universal stress UspA family protein
MVETGFPPPTPIRSLLVPLDGSRLAEAAIPAAIALAHAFDATVTLLHVLESDPPAEVHGEPHLARTQDAAAYLEGIATRFTSTVVSVSVHVHADPERDVSSSIVQHADEIGADVIVLANHGSGGLRGFLFGRVAQQVLQRGRRPVLAIPVAERQPSPAVEVPRRLAVLLNRTDEAEAAIPLSATMAQAFAARMHLILAVPTRGTLDADRSATATLLPSAAKEVLELEEREGRAYLDSIALELSSHGLPVTTSVVRGDPAERAVQEAMRVDANLLAMTTHARGGLSGLLSGSVGAKILARSNLPLLLVPAPI